jgi:PAS domain S-box-containing protein
MKVSSAMMNEEDRIASLYQLKIIDTPAEEDFDDIVALAAQICDTPVSTIAFADKERFWFKAKFGIEIKETPTANSFCTASSPDDDLMIVPDALADTRFNDNQLVKKYGIVFFAGIPLINDEGFRLGYLCVMDKKSRTISDLQISGLRILARQVAILLRLRSKIIRLQQAEEESRSSEEQINTIFHNAIDAVVVMDDHGIITQWNPKAESIFGWSAIEAIGQDFHQIVLPERYRSCHLERMKRYEANGDEVIANETIEITALRKNNSEFDIALGISPATIKGKNFFINFISDITERKVATNKLDKQKEFYENILNELPTDIAVFDANHKYLFVNPGAIKDEELRKYIIGKDDFEYAEYRNRDKSVAHLRREQFEEVKNSGKGIRWEDTIHDPDGNPITHLRRLFPIFNEKGELNMVIGFGIDITDRKIMEVKQTALVKQLSAQNVQLVDFCNIVSHNLRAPLVNMSMLVKFIEESEDEAEQRMLIAKINPVIENLNTTFNELVESIQIKQDLEIKSEKIKLKDCLQRTLEVLDLEIQKSNAVIEADFEEVPVIYYPIKYLFSIFHNLVSNALKYQSPKRKPLIQIVAKKVDDTVVLSVKDNGLGIDLVKHKDNFFKIGRVFHRHPNAKGFGLFMTKTQVDAMDGRIWAESAPDEGTTFFIEFKNQKL